jgi:branched-chain amino acid transport system permease protein
MGAFLTSRFMSDVFLGLTSGAIYATVALSLVLIWRSTNVLNFAQGAMSMFASYIGLTELDRHVPFYWCVAIAILAGFLIGGATERVLVRPLYGKPEINPIVVMVGFLGLLVAVAAALWKGSGYGSSRFITEPFSTVNFEYHGNTINISPFAIFQVSIAIIVMVAIGLLFRYTNLGLKLRASAANPEVARLLGVRVNRMLTLGWMLASAVGAAAAVAVGTSNAGLDPHMMDAVFVSGFIAAAIGWLESPVGAVVGGFALGITSQFVLDYWSTNVAPIVPLVLLLVVLMVRPQGIFTRATARRV